MRHPLRSFAALALAAVLALAPVSAAGTEPPFFAGLEPVRTYDGRFSDLPQDAWYTPYAQRAFELGLMQGQGGDVFAPLSNLTLAEGLAATCNLLSVYLDDGAELSGGDPWYQHYLTYGEGMGLVEPGQYKDYTALATRADLAMMVAALPPALLADKNRVEDNAIPDVYEDDPWHDAAYALYRSGVITGVDAQGTFNPLAPITRGEMAAILAAVADPAARKEAALAAPNADPLPAGDTVTLYSDNGVTLQATEETLADYLALNWRTQPFPPVTRDPQTEKFTQQEKIDLVNQASLLPMKTNNPELDDMVDQIFAQIHTPEMTTYEKLMACYDYLVDHTTYGYSPGPWYSGYAEEFDGDVVTMALALLNNGSGACNHYAAAFQVMARRIGLQCWYYHCNGGSASGGGGHYYNVIDLGGVPFTFDAQVDDKMDARGMPHWYWCKSYVEISRAYLNTERMPFGEFKLAE